MSICSVYARLFTKNILYILSFNPQSIHEVSVISILQIRKLSHTGICLHKSISQRLTLALYNSEAILASHFFFKLLPYVTWLDLTHPSPLVHMEEVRQERVSVCFRWLHRLRTVQYWNPGLLNPTTFPPEISCLLSLHPTSRSLLKAQASVITGDLGSWWCEAVIGRAL